MTKKRRNNGRNKPPNARGHVSFLSDHSDRQTNSLLFKIDCAGAYAGGQLVYLCKDQFLLGIALMVARHEKSVDVWKGSHTTSWNGVGHSYAWLSRSWCRTAWKLLQQQCLHCPACTGRRAFTLHIDTDDERHHCAKVVEVELVSFFPASCQRGRRSRVSSPPNLGRRDCCTAYSAEEACTLACAGLGEGTEDQPPRLACRSGG